MPIPAPTQSQLLNGDFEAGNTGWTLDLPPGATGTLSIEQNLVNADGGSWYARATGNTAIPGSGFLISNNNIVPVYPGLTITASARAKVQGAANNTRAVVNLTWIDANGDAILVNTSPALDPPAGSTYRTIQVVGTAPAGAAQVQLRLGGFTSPSTNAYFDNVQWNYVYANNAVLSSPSEGSEHEQGAVITLSVETSMTGPTPTSVSYKYGSTLIGTVTTAPFVLNTTAIPQGNHALTAEVLFSDNTVVTTAAVNIVVGPPSQLRDYKGSNSLTYLVAENFQGLSAAIPAVAQISGVELVLNYDVRILGRYKDAGVADPALANQQVLFDVINNGTVEAILMSKSGTNYTALGTGITSTIPIERPDFTETESGITDGMRWSVLDAAAAVVTMGNDASLFGLDTMSVADFTAAAVGIRFYPNLATRPSYTDAGDASYRFALDKLRLRVYFEAGSAEYYFASADKTQVIKGSLVSYFVNNGNFRTADASGILQLEQELEVVAGTQRYIGPDWTIHSGFPATDDNQIGKVAPSDARADYGMEYNKLPGYEEVIENQSRYTFITANFYGDENLNSIYGANGVGRGFAYNGEFFYNIYTTPETEKDKPRHVAFHHGHLALGYKEGRVDISVLGQPYNFDGVLGASSWAIGDRVTGLIPLSGMILGVFGQKTVVGITGTTLDNFTTQTLSPKMGALEYTVVDMGQPIYANAYGLYTMTQTQEYGDYLGVPISQDVSPWLRPRLQKSGKNNKEIVVSWPVRSKNQYRMAFADGEIMTLTMNGGQNPTFSKQAYYWHNRWNDSDGNDYPSLSVDPRLGPKMVPVAISSELDQTGRERIHIAPKVRGA